MNAKQIARLMCLTVQASTRGEISHEERNDIIQSLGAQAREAGFHEEAGLLYWEMCQTWLNRQAA